MLGEEPLVLPDSLAIGDAIRHVREEMQTEKGLGLKYTFSGSVYFERMKERGSYTTDVAEIRRRVDAAGMTDVFATRVGDIATPALRGLRAAKPVAQASLPALG